MQYQANTPNEYVAQIPADRVAVFENLRQQIIHNLPKGFQETIQYGMLGYVVPHSIYPSGYHCNPKEMLPFAGLASQKNSINFYHMGIYADNDLKDWFVNKYNQVCKTKLDMGKSCIRFKKFNDIPLELIGELMTKMTVEQWITLYEGNIKK